jgi:hypothetical protein
MFMSLNDLVIMADCAFMHAAIAVYTGKVNQPIANLVHELNQHDTLLKSKI